MLFWIENQYCKELKILSGIVSFWHNMKWAQKALCLTIINSPDLKKKKKKKKKRFKQQMHSVHWSKWLNLVDGGNTLDKQVIMIALSSLVPQR